MKGRRFAGRARLLRWRMRSGLVLLLPIAACFTSNPTFGLITATSGDEVTGSSGATSEAPTTSAGAGTTTTTTVTTTTASATSSPGTTTDATSEPLTSTSEPVTSGTSGTSGISDTSGTGGTGSLDLPPATCGFKMAGDQVRRVFDVDLNADVMNCGESATWMGPMEMTGGTPTLTKTENCDVIGDSGKLKIGKAWPAAADRYYKCVKATVYWAKVEGECRIGALKVIDLDPNNDTVGLPLYLAGLSRVDSPLNFPMWPTLEMGDPCGCPDEVVGCCTPDAGHYAFKAESGTSVTPNSTHTFKANNGSTYKFTNIQSYIDGECVQGTVDGTHLDWFAELLPL